MLPHDGPHNLPDSVDPKYMANFRETNWFKRGELVDVLPEEDSVELPVEDRYLDEGNTTYTDSVLYGVHTGETTRIPAWMMDDDDDVSAMPDPSPAFAITFRPGTASDPKAEPELRTLVRELQHRTRTIVAICASAMVVLGVLVAGVL